MYLLAKKIVEQYEKSKQTRIVSPKKTIEERKLEFKESLKPFLNQYGSEMLNNFYLYWTEHGENDRKFRKEKQKSFNISLRLNTWAKRSKDFNTQNKKPLTLAQKMRKQHGIE